MKNVVSIALILSLTVPGFAQSSPPGCTPAPGQSVCSVPGSKSIWNNGPQTYGLLIGVPVGIAGALIVRHHYHHKAQEELKRLEGLKAQQLATDSNSTNSTATGKDGEVWGFSGVDWSYSGFRGVEVLRVSKQSAAENAGLRAGDVIRTVNGKSVGSTQELTATVAQIEAGSTVSIGYMVKTQLGWMPKETTLVPNKLF